MSLVPGGDVHQDTASVSKTGQTDGYCSLSDIEGPAADTFRTPSFDNVAPLPCTIKGLRFAADWQKSCQRDINRTAS